MAGRKMFTELALRNLKPPATGRVDFGDALAPGLVLRVTQRGVKSWSVIYKVPGERGLSETGRALKGNIVAAIFLSKTRLGWRETGPSQDGGAKVAVQINMPGAMSEAMYLEGQADDED